MRTIEVAGPIGAGKSSLVPHLYDALLLGGARVSLLDELRVGSRPASALASAAFALRHPSLTWRTLQAALKAPIPWWHRRLIIGLTLGLGGRLLLAGRRVSDEHWVIVDEGFVHRAINLFGWREPPVPAEEVRAYVSAVPIQGLLVLVNAPPEVGLRRAARRGLPKRLAGRPQEFVDGFASTAHDTIHLAADAMRARGGTVVRVDNQRSVKRAAERAGERILAGLAESPASAEPVAFTARFPMTPRPDRLLRRALARRAATLDRRTVEAVAERFGLALRGRHRAVTSPGGRGAAVLLRSDQGELLLKRYKPSHEREAIEVEHSVLRELERQDVRAPRLVATPDGQTLLEHEGSIYAVFRYFAGYRHPHEYLMAPSDRRLLESAAGAALGDLHLALARHRPPPSPTNGFVSIRGARVRSVEWYTERLAHTAAPRRVRAWAHGALWGLWEELDDQLTRGVVHGDYGPYNLLVRSGEPPVVIDFELARLDWRLVDLATGIPRFAQRRTGFDVEAGRRVLEGYRKRTGLLPVESRLIPHLLAFLSLQRAAVCWSRARDDDTVAWDDEARTRIILAEELLGGRHPLHRVVRA